MVITEGTSAEFKYHIAGNEAVMIVFLQGEMTSRTAESVKTCFTDIMGRAGIRSAIISFASVNIISGDAIPIFAQMQICLRKLSVDIRLCGMRSDQKEKLAKAGLIRSEEHYGTIRDGIASLATGRKLSA